MTVLFFIGIAVIILAAGALVVVGIGWCLIKMGMGTEKETIKPWGWTQRPPFARRGK